MTEQSLQKNRDQSVTRVQPPLTETVYVPDVDICDTGEEIVVCASMPGVDRDSASVTVESGVLRIEGKGALDIPDGYQLVGQEYAVGHYRREFTLSDSVATDGLKAKMSQGVLTVTLPKKEEVKKRKVEIAG